MQTCQSQEPPYTTYFPAPGMKVTFHIPPVRLRASFPGATTRNDSHSVRVSLNLSIFSRGSEIRQLRVLTSHPRKVRFTSQWAPFGDEIEGSLGSPEPNTPTQSDASGPETCKAESSPSSFWTCARPISSTYSTPKNESPLPPLTAGPIFTPWGMEVGLPISVLGSIRT